MTGFTGLKIRFTGFKKNILLILSKNNKI